MPKKYRVTLSDQERNRLTELVRKRSAKAEPVKRALILLAADENNPDAQHHPATDEQIHLRYSVAIRTVERLRQRLVEHGLDTALFGKKREPTKERIFDGTVEAHLVALRCSQPPEGYTRWSLRLLADRMVELGYVESISHESVRQMLKKTNSSPGVSSPG